MNKNKIYIVEISSVIDTQVMEKLLKYVSDTKRKAINNFRFDIDKKLSLYSDCIVRKTACDLLKIGNDKINYVFNEYGKPHIADFPDFYFNISHTRNAIAAVFSDSEIGIDVEKIEENEPDIAKNFFKSEEYDYIYSKSEHCNRRFYEIWTKKEAYVKFLGKGLAVPLDSFSVLNSEPVISSLEMSKYYVSLCSETLDINSFEINIISEYDILNLLKEFA